MNHALLSYSVHEGLEGGFPADDYMTWWQTERKCPVCKTKVNTNGNGLFLCPSCKYSDKQDVSKLYASGLDYVFSLHARGAMGRHGKQNMRKSWR